ncbi:tRNA-dihydrouridine(16/17) synthase [NAD(P)(+)]-like isoform X2 [Stegodyphus dumicola]|uniref:tRNA-dihydrouridine(16/17) synthase [NAD(P)(+)]-like isoform X2 n=1 Tax=Stegodyphus dumicola TaxID=202533 RepID=UPI0015AC4080|nr:tRNA-dihydrouridine(16/17) synthase [NAD(P)(+)]-like isoform X2 [Stegodyphus dumicola]
MAVKQIGYDFWDNVLKSPKYVAAPMVDMSELSFRMLCRSYGSDLCFTPMLHSQQFIQDSLYRQDTFSTCAEDRPLIIQFCANDPITFVNAASMVSSKCDGIDLNLGCPQAIAKKGHYGAFLQEDWECIHSIVQKAANELSVPVTCKMRILPGNFRKSVEYAKMLENSGCSVLTVHGRTRKQKGHATGLASWDVIKEIKANVKIPVIANGNILSFDDVKNCLEYTGADAVMSAEGLLHNPALFTGKNPPVWEIVDEYLKLAERYSTSIRCVRCHLFKILYLCLHQDDNVRQILAEGSSYSDFYKVCNILKNLPSKILKEYDGDGDVFDYDLHKLSDSLFTTHENRSGFISNCNSKLAKTDCDILSNHFFSSDDSDGSDSDIEDRESCLSVERTLTNEMKKKCTLNLPVWICHSRPRITDNEETRGSYSHYFNLPEKKDHTNEEHGLSKKKLRKLRRHERVLAAMKEKRKIQKLRRKLKIAELKQNQVPETNDVPKEKVTKKQQKLLIKERLLKAQGSSPKVCINLGFASEMEKKELNRLSSQLRRLYGSNRHSSSPLHLIFCSFSSSDELYQICQRKNDGFSSYVVKSKIIWLRCQRKHQKNCMK